jgi:branched-chain amino acid transport system ATP-binding protein
VALLAVKDLHKSYAGIQAVKGVSFELDPGEVLALIGPNGAGKSTCFAMLNGQIEPDRGAVILDGMNIAGLPPRRIWRLGVGRTFQVTATFGSMSVVENVQMALLSDRRRLADLWRPARRLMRGEALALLERVGMAEQADRPCAILAYGDLKRLELAVALANNPRLLLMDEPTAGMAPSERISLMALTAELARSRNMAVLFTEHDMDVVFTHAQRIIVLSYGQIIATGSPAEVRANRQVQSVYLGSWGSP